MVEGSADHESKFPGVLPQRIKIKLPGKILPLCFTRHEKTMDGKPLTDPQGKPCYFWRGANGLYIFEPPREKPTDASIVLTQTAVSRQLCYGGAALQSDGQTLVICQTPDKKGQPVFALKQIAFSNLQVF